MTSSVYNRDKCRICGKVNLYKWLTLPAMPLVDAFLEINSKKKEMLQDINVYVCKDCGASQLMQDIDYSDYYIDYMYTSSSSDFTINFMSRLASKLFTNYNLKPGCSVIEIGSGDGCQLSQFKKLGANVFGFEPSEVLCENSRKAGIPVHNGLFHEAAVQFIPEEFLSTDVILLTYTFDHMPDPMSFLETVQKVINPTTGLLVIEVHDLDKIITRKEYCLFHHEHLTYLTIETMRKALNLAGFDLDSSTILQEEERRGNSLLIVAKPKNELRTQQTNGLMDLEIEKYREYAQNIQNSIDNIDKFVELQVSQGKRVAGYGAGGRGISTLAAMKSAEKISYIVDQNKNFQGKMAPKSHLPVFSPDRLQEDPVDVLLVFSYGYLKEIKEKVSTMNNAPKSVVSLLEVL